MGVCLGVLCKPNQKNFIYDIKMSPKKIKEKNEKSNKVLPEN